jgi:hypothetical protein
MTDYNGSLSKLPSCFLYPISLAPLNILSPFYGFGLEIWKVELNAALLPKLLLPMNDDALDSTLGVITVRSSRVYENNLGYNPFFPPYLEFWKSLNLLTVPASV